MKMLVTMIAVLGMGIGCFAEASQGTKDSPSPTEEVIMIEGSSCVDCCAQDPKSPCVKNGKCVCKNKKECKDCMKHMKKYDQKMQKKCAQKCTSAGQDIVIVEGVAWMDCCAQDPKSPCVKNGKCVCKNKKECKDCMKHMKKCDQKGAAANQNH